MLYWVGIDISSQIKELKKGINNIYKELNFKKPSKLPYHISLKMSFELDEKYYDEVIKLIKNYLKTIKPFVINTADLEWQTNIVWYTISKSEELKKIHNDLNELINKKYNIPLHPFDGESFKFHITLFLNDNDKLMFRAYHLVKGYHCPSTLKVNRFLIGGSFTSKIEDYKVFKKVKI